MLFCSAGSLYLKDCPSERLLPIYLIVGGVFAIISGGCCGGQRAKERSKFHTQNTSLENIIPIAKSQLKVMEMYHFHNIYFKFFSKTIKTNFSLYFSNFF